MNDFENKPLSEKDKLFRALRYLVILIIVIILFTLISSLTYDILRAVLG